MAGRVRDISPRDTGRERMPDGAQCPTAVPARASARVFRTRLGWGGFGVALGWL